MSELGMVAKMQALHETLDAGGVPHAFGGALALAWCVGEVRTTMDIDLNLFVPVEEVLDALAVLPDEVEHGDGEVALLRRDGQARLRWGRHPVDVFLNTTAFHDEVAARVRWEPLGETELPFLACTDLAVFKAFFDRGKDWVDLEAMGARSPVPLRRALPVLVDHLGPDDPRVTRLADLVGDLAD